MQADEHLVDKVTEALYHLLNGRVPAPIGIPEGHPEDEIRQLITYVNRFLGEYGPFTAAMQAIAQGNLDATPPGGRTAVALAYRALQSNLRHLTWKTRRIATGALDETVDFMGEFSMCFNSMTRQLKDSFQAVEQRNQELRLANEVIEAERAKSEKLIRNVLPPRVAEELKQRGHSEPQSFEEVTVYFSDIVGFTRLSSQITPRDLIEELNAVFTRFDDIMASHGCERIKSIGDAYLAVCGMPEPNPDHARTMVSAAVEALHYMAGHSRERGGGWQIRIGIHSGPLVGGIVGVRKYIYDIFGDTVNTASRMETCSEPMRINVSEATYRLAKDHFRFLEREPVEVKGKGLMKMYFVEA